VSFSTPPTFGKYSLRQNAATCGIPEDTVPDGTVLHLAIMGNGYFVVRRAENNEYRATQVGRFTVDDTGYLLSETAWRLQGRTGGELCPMGDLQVNAAGLPAASIPRSAMVCYTVDDWGKISVQLSDGAHYLCGQIMLQNFQDPQALIHEGHYLYSNLAAAGPLPCLAEPGSNGLGIIQSGVLELAIARHPRLAA
jgi:flagellar hook protein FlgE